MEKSGGLIYIDYRSQLENKKYYKQNRCHFRSARDVCCCIWIFADLSQLFTFIILLRYCLSNKQIEMRQTLYYASQKQTDLHWNQ